ncbi:MAG: hypothetical protein ABR505_06575 [Actinomycetota bacterium]
MDLSRLTRGEQIVGGAGILLLLFSFLPLWAKYDVPTLGTERFTPWDGNAFTLLPKLAFVLVILAIALVVIRLTATDLKLPVPEGQIYLGISALATLLLLITLLSGPRLSGLSGFGFEASRGPLLFIGWLLAGAMTFGGFLHMREEEGTPGIGPGPTMGPQPPTTGPTPPPPPPAS